MPTEKEEREDLAWVMCVLMMASRQLALVNKTGQVNFEVNVICRMFIEWIRNIIHQHFMSFFSSMLLLSYDRVIAGYLTRQIASTFMATCARHYAECDSSTDANTNILLDMETAPVTLQSCNLAICNAITHLADTNLMLINQFIRDKLRTPVLPVEFIIRILGDETLDMSSPYYEQIFSWMSHVVQNRQNEAECIMGYVSVNKLGTQEDYSAKEAYLESYFGITKGNFYTYMIAVRECCSKTFDLSNFLSLETPMLDFTRFLSRIGVGGDGMIQGYQQAPLAENQRNTYLFCQNAQQANDSQRAGGCKCWVNIIQHLLITAIQGPNELHADNMVSFGANLTELILSRCAPLQSIPAGIIMHETYHHVHEEVLPFHTHVAERPEYFIRTINDHSALETGLTSELPAVLGPHPPEDVMHLGAWIQLYTTVYNGTKPDLFQCMPEYNGRPPELVIGRRYPLTGRQLGTIMLQEHGLITVAADSTWEPLPPVPLENWWKFLCAKQLMVAPLIFRHFAAFACPDSADEVCVGVPHDDGQFISASGVYNIGKSPNMVKQVSFETAHGWLLPLGTHMLVKSSALHRFDLTSPAQWVRGCLRYPEGPATDDPFSIYITVPLKEVPGSDAKAQVIHAPVQSCRIAREGVHYDMARFAISRNGAHAPR